MVQFSFQLTFYDNSCTKKRCFNGNWNGNCSIMQTSTREYHTSDLYCRILANCRTRCNICTCCASWMAKTWSERDLIASAIELLCVVIKMSLLNAHNSFLLSIHMQAWTCRNSLNYYCWQCREFAFPSSENIVCSNRNVQAQSECMKPNNGHFFFTI